MQVNDNTTGGFQYKEIITSTIPFQVYSFDAVFSAIQPYLKDGFKFDLESNQGYPKQIGTVLTFSIQEYEKVEVDLPKELEPEQVTEVLIETKQEPMTRRAKAQAKG